jgi:endo-1,4-beta-mannosidase
MGAMLWCYTDYDPALWETPPFDKAIHERSFGLWRADGSPKPSVDAVAALTRTNRIDRPDDFAWIDIEPDEFFLDPATHLRRLYRRYRNGV